MLSRSLKLLVRCTISSRSCSSGKDFLVTSPRNANIPRPRTDDDVNKNVTNPALPRDNLPSVEKNRKVLLKYPQARSSKAVLSRDPRLEPFARPGSILASYVNESEFLQGLLKLGVNFYKLEKNLDAIPFILGLRTENIAGHLLFFKDLGLTPESIGGIITKNPFIFKEDIDDLQVRINYLEYKRFTKDMIIRIVSTNPMWLSTRCQEIDSRLGVIQQMFGLAAPEVRTLTITYPKLITEDLEKIKRSQFVLTELMGFTNEEIKAVVVNKPKLLINGRDKLMQTFDYLHNVMKIPQERIVQVPGILTWRRNKIQPRHMFLERLGKAQYDPKQPNYVSLMALVSGTDVDFCSEVAKCSVQLYNSFLKSL